MKHLVLTVLTLAAVAFSGCVVRAPVPVAVARPVPCAGGVWVPGHYGPGGFWHPAHWQCAGGVVIR
jgi:hypothetical protein